MSEKQIKIFPTVDELNQFAATEFVRLSFQAIAECGRFTVSLSGGSTPKKLFQVLASNEFRLQIEWQKIHFFFGDERNVPIASDKSNYRMASENLFSKLEIPAENIHRFLTEDGDSETVAFKMEDEIRDFFGLKIGEFPRFDLIFLGMGADGHTATLFPDSSALHERAALVAATWVGKFNALVGVYAHGSKLPESKFSAPVAESFLVIKNRPGTCHSNANCRN